MANEIIGRADVVLPDEYINSIIKLAEAESVVLSLARKVPMSTGSATMPVLGQTAVASFINPRDTGYKPLSNAKWAPLHLVAEEVGTIITAPESVLDDSPYDIAGQIEEQAGTALAKAIDQAALWGNGAPSTWPTNGVYGHAVAAGNTRVRGSVAGKDLAEDLNQVEGMVEEDGYLPNGWVSRLSIRRELRGLRDDVHRPIFYPANPLTSSPQTLYDLPLRFSNFAWDPTKADAIVGDWSNAVVGMRKEITLKVLTEAAVFNSDGSLAYNLPQQDMIGIRVYTRLGFAIANPQSVQSLAPDQAHRSPFAVLTPAA